jgi:hypothetical protein
MQYSANTAVSPCMALAGTGSYGCASRTWNRDLWDGKPMSYMPFGSGDPRRVPCPPGGSTRASRCGTRETSQNMLAGPQAPKIVRTSEKDDRELAFPHSL